MGDDFGVGLGFELGAFALKLFAQFAEVLDDAVVNYRNAISGMRMGVALGRPPVGGPAGMTDANTAVQRLLRQPAFEIAQFAFGAQTREMAVLERGNTRGIVAAIFEALE